MYEEDVRMLKVIIKDVQDTLISACTETYTDKAGKEKGRKARTHTDINKT